MASLPREAVNLLHKSLGAPQLGFGQVIDAPYIEVDQPLAVPQHSAQTTVSHADTMGQVEIQEVAAALCNGLHPLLTDVCTVCKRQQF